MDGDARIAEVLELDRHLGVDAALDLELGILEEVVPELEVLGVEQVLSPDGDGDVGARSPRETDVEPRVVGRVLARDLVDVVLEPAVPVV